MKQRDSERQAADRAQTGDAVSISRVGMYALAGLVGASVLAQPVVASGGSAAANNPGGIHHLIELLQLLVGLVAVAAAALGVQAMRGGRMEWAFYSLTAGVVTFLLQRLWHSAHEFGLVGALPGIVDQLLFLVATAMIGLGFGIVYRIMRPSSLFTGLLR